MRSIRRAGVPAALAGFWRPARIAGDRDMYLGYIVRSCRISGALRLLLVFASAISGGQSKGPR